MGIYMGTHDNPKTKNINQKHIDQESEYIFYQNLNNQNIFDLENAKR